MRKKIVVGLIIILISIALYNKKIYAIIGDVKITLHDFGMTNIYSSVDTDEKREVLEELRTVYGYTGDSLPQGDETMKFITKIHKLSEDKNFFGKYTIQIGGAVADKDGNTGKKIDVSEEDLIKKYGYDKEKGENSWDVVLIGGVVSGQVGREGSQTYAVKTSKLYAGDDYEKGNELNLNEGTDIKEQDITRGSEVVDEVKDTLDDVTDIIGNLHMKLYEIKLMPFDAIQSVIDMLQTVNYGGSKRFLPWNIVYPGEDIQSDNNKNQYVNYTTGSDDLGKDGQKVAFINEKESGLKINKISEWIFGAKPQIPVIPIDMYALAKGKVEIFDINFLTGQNNKDLHSDNSVWLIIRNFISAVIHVILYLGASILIIMLVLHGISLVKEAIIAERSSPEERKKHIGGIHEMTIAFIKLLGCVLIMGICIFVSDAVFEDMKVTDKMELPIRVNVGSGAKDGSGNQYSFSTNIIGYVRFMANICDPDYVGFKALYTWGYIILVVINVALILVMFIRLIAIILLSLAGPIIAVAGVFNRKELFGVTYQEWAKHYAIWASIQLVFAIIYRILLNVCFSN